MKTSSKLKVKSSKDIRHQVHIHNFPLPSLKMRKNEYTFKVKKKYDYQKAIVKVKLNPSVIQKKETITEDFYRITFHDEQINIYGRYENFDKSIIYKWGKYRLNYMINNEMVSIMIKCSFNKNFYMHTIIPRIKKVRTNKRSMKAQNYNDHKNSLSKDFVYADQFPYHYSPNSDGNRSRREVFGGTFSGGSRSSGKKKR